jgi:hypothetical protein
MGRHKHRHIVKVGLSLLANAHMPLKYWDEAFLAATYLINCLPTKVLQFSTPLKLLFKEKPNYDGLHTFGCACWPNLHPFNTHKLQFRSKQCVFLRYSNLHKGFKCLDVAGGRVYISRDVVFDDGVYPLSKLNPDAGTRLQSEIFLLPSQYQPLSLPGHGGEISKFSSACVPINPGATNGICSFEVAVENSGSDHGELQEISHMQEDGSEPAMGATPSVDPKAASLRSIHPIATTDPRVAPLPAGSPVRAILKWERSSDGQVSPCRDIRGSFVHRLGCSLPSLGAPGEQSRSSVEAS